MSAHIFAEAARKYLPRPQAILVNYKPGGASAIAADYFLKQSPDGYNLLWNASDLMLKLALDGDRLPFRIEDFIPIGTIGITPAILAVSKESPYKRLEDLIDYARKIPGNFRMVLLASQALPIWLARFFRCGAKSSLTTSLFLEEVRE